MQLPITKREEIDARLRNSGYGQIDGLTAWLKLNGIVASRSAVGRYAHTLRAADAAAGVHTAKLREAAVEISRHRKGGPGGKVPALLGALQAAQAQQGQIVAALVEALNA